MNTFRYYIGIDTGTSTGFAVWSKPDRKLTEVKTLFIHEAMEKVLEYHREFGEDLFVRFEDARLRSWFGNKSRESLQGAGSIKRDCVIWDDFLKDKKIHYASMAPKLGLTKLTAEVFKRITGWEGSTTNHSRDAGMIVFGI